MVEKYLFGDVVKMDDWALVTPTSSHQQFRLAPYRADLAPLPSWKAEWMNQQYLPVSIRFVETGRPNAKCYLSQGKECLNISDWDSNTTDGEQRAVRTWQYSTAHQFRLYHCNGLKCLEQAESQPSRGLLFHRQNIQCKCFFAYISVASTKVFWLIL